MHVYHLKSDIVEIVSQSISKNKTIGIVPTMGALHHGWPLKLDGFLLNTESN